MDQKKDNLKLKQIEDYHSNNDKPINHSKKEIKYKLMDKYNISSEEAKKILITLKKKQIKVNNEKIPKNHVNQDNVLKNNYESNKQQYKVYNKKDKTTAQINEKNFQKDSEIKNQIPSTSKQKEGTIKNNEKQQNLDSIIENIIPNYNQQLSIEANNIDLTFEVSSEKIDTLKEAFISFFKKTYNKKFKIHAINNISFKIYQGEKVGVIGYNGAGKSTLLNVIAGIYPLDKGFIKTTGNISPLLSLGAGFDINYSGRKNIFLNGAVLGYDKKFLETKVEEIIEFSELGELIDIPIKNYSAGMLAKLGFSIATAVNPDILIIDEILGVGDVNFQKKSRDKLRSLMDGGTTVLLVSHSIPQIRELCDKAIWIDDGKLREIGEVNTVCDHYLKDAEKASNQQLSNIQFR